MAALVTAMLAAPAAGADGCRGSVYLTLDTGNMRHAELIAEILRKHDVKATFFLANEPTWRGDHALDASWSAYWSERVAEGHAFGSHTWRHGRFIGDAGGGAVRYRPQFGAGAGKIETLTSDQVCGELRRVDRVFNELTGRPLDPFWRAPGGRTTPNALAAAQTCGFAHVRWADAGFLGDELPSDRFPNETLVHSALRDVHDGDVLMAHLGIWSRKDPFAPMLDPLIAGLRQRGFCFRTLREHPQLVRTAVPAQLAAGARGRSIDSR
jgi:peptidoglycan/xylan/chitin deacetylase (PgdA/CDA1 family)